MHKRLTFIPGTIGRLVKKYGISFDYLQVPPHMICRKQDHPGEKFFILTLRRQGAVLKLPYSQGYGVKTWPTIEETLENLAADILLYINHESAEDLASEFGGEFDDWGEQWEVLEALYERTRAFLGLQGFQELIDMATSGFELGGDNRWQRQHRICG